MPLHIYAKTLFNIETLHYGQAYKILLPVIYNYKL